MSKIIMHGNPVDGLSFIGPFPDGYDIHDGFTDPLHEWWIVDLDEPDPAVDFQPSDLDDAGEVTVPLASGWTLRSGSSTTEFTSGEYVRLCRPDGTEHLYWSNDEWATDPTLVMGAIINAAASSR